MSFTFVFFILNILNYIKCNEKIIQLPLYFDGSAFLFDLKIGDSSSLAKLDQDIDYIIISPSLVDPDVNKKLTYVSDADIKLKFAPLVTKMFKAECSLDQIQFNLLLCLLNKNSSYDAGVNRVGMKYRFQNNSLSFLHQLKAQKKIDKLIYGYYPYSDTNGTLFLGGFPGDIIKKHSKYKAEIDVFENSSFWGTTLTMIKPLNMTKKKEYYAYFHSGYEYIYLPDSLYSQIETEFFNETMYVNRYCWTTTFFEVLFSYECLCDKVKYLPGFTFLLDNYSFVLQAEDVFKQTTENTCELMFRQNLEGNNVIFGGIFLKKYISIFNIEEKKMFFYSNNKLIHSQSQKECLTNKELIKICIMVILLGITFELFYKITTTKFVIRITFDVYKDK